MNTDEFYAQLRAELAKRLQSDSRLTTIAEKIKQKEADFKDTAEYSQIVARHISKLIQEKIGTNSGVGIEFVCKELLKDHYSAINDVLGTVQSIVDEKQNIHIAPQKAPFPQERVNKVAHALMNPRVPIEVIKRRAGAPVENVANSFHDDYIKENAKFRNDAGLKCYINRTTDGNCCDWCTKIAGRYVYGEHPDDVFRRHDNCGCKTVYENGRQRQDVWTKKSWEAPDVANGSYKPTKLSFEQGKELEKKNLRYKGITNQSRWNEIFNDYGASNGERITPKQVYEDLQTSDIGKDVLRFAENLPERIRFDYSSSPNLYGEQFGSSIVIYMRNCESVERVSRTIIHECTHMRYGIGQSQWAECVCFAQELKHKFKRNQLTYSEKKRIIEVVKKEYANLNWRKGGTIYGRKK